MKEGKTRVLICGVLPPPYFGHSMVYEMLLRSSFTEAFDIAFLDMNFWSYETNTKVTGRKILKLVIFFFHYLWLIVSHRPRYVLYNTSFYKMPFLKDFLFCAVGILLGRKVVIHDHGQYVRELHDDLPGWQQGMLRWMLKYSIASIVMGERVKSVYDGLMPNEKLFTVPGTVEDTKDIDVFVQKKPGLNVLFFSHMSASKGIFVAFDIASLVLRAHREARFTFAGPMESDDVVRKIEKLQSQFPERIEYLGYIEDVRARTKIFREADIFIFPTLRDVFGLVLLHAMAEGLPIVASREGTIPEIIFDGDNGFLCEKGQPEEFAQKILLLLNNDMLRGKISTANRMRFERIYALPKYGPYMVDVFQGLEKTGTITKG